MFVMYQMNMFKSNVFISTLASEQLHSLISLRNDPVAANGRTCVLNDPHFTECIQCCKKVLKKPLIMTPGEHNVLDCTKSAKRAEVPVVFAVSQNHHISLARVFISAEIQDVF